MPHGECFHVLGFDVMFCREGEGRDTPDRRFRKQTATDESDIKWLSRLRGMFFVCCLYSVDLMQKRESGITWSSCTAKGQPGVAPGKGPEAGYAARMLEVNCGPSLAVDSTYPIVGPHAAAPARSDEGLLQSTLPSLLHMENPYSYKKFQ